jgi:hypothetical protein
MIPPAKKHFSNPKFQVEEDNVDNTTANHEVERASLVLTCVPV